MFTKFKNAKLFENAFLHRSYLNEHPGCDLPSNERLEFLGDSVLAFLTSEHLYKKFPDEPEGKLTAYRSSLVKTETLAEAAKGLAFGEKLKMSKGEDESGGRESGYILADSFEAFLGALYLDRGVRECRKFLKEALWKELPGIVKNKSYKDHKSVLQEVAQEKLDYTPIYKVLEETGPDHAKNFRVAVFIRGKKEGEGSGSSKQKAEVEAAHDALEKLKWQ